MGAGPGELRAHHAPIGHQLHPCTDHKIGIGVGRFHGRCAAALGLFGHGRRRFGGYGLGGDLHHGLWCDDGRGLFKGLLVQTHQALEQGAGLDCRVVDGLEALAQLGEQPGNGFIEPVRLLPCQIRLGTPQQHGHQRQVTPRVVLAAVAVHHLRQGNHVGPGACGEVKNIGRHLLQVRQLTDIRRHLFSQQLPLLGMQAGFFLGLLLCLDFLFLLVPSRLQRLEHGIERTGVFDLVGGQVLYGFRDQAHEAAESLVCLGGKSQAALSQLIKQAARGMGAIGKKAPIVVHQLLERRLQALDRQLDGGQQARILRDVRHHAPDHLHRHGGGLRRSLHGHGGIHHRRHPWATPPGQGHRQ